MKRLLIAFSLCFICSVSAFAQRDWMTDNADVQRSAWIRTDQKINPDALAKPGFQFLWKYKTKNLPKGLNNLQPPATLERLIGFRGFRMLGFFAGSDNNLITIDTDLGRLEWEKKLKVAASTAPSTLACPGGMTTGVARPALTTILPGPVGPITAGRSSPAKSAVGKPDEGAVTLANVRPGQTGMGPNRNDMPQANQRVNVSNPPGGQFGAGPFLVYALAGDGKLYSMHLSNGQDFQPPVPFIPAGANASGLTVLDNHIFVATTGGCGGAANGVWMLDTVSKEVKTWKGNVAGSTGFAFDGNGVLYVTTGSGGDKPNALVALDPNTLTEKASFTAPAEFVTSPVIFSHGGKTLIAAATKDGSLHVFDSANLSTPLTSSAAGLKGATGALASWQDRSGTRWILAPHEGVLPAGFSGTGVTKGAVLGFKLGTDNKLTPGWASRDLVSPLTPTIINGVVFATSSGEFKSKDSKMTALRSGKAVLYALDGATGKELWSSGTTMTSFAHGNALAGGMGQIYLTTYDGTVYTFGFPMEH